MSTVRCYTCAQAHNIPHGPLNQNSQKRQSETCIAATWACHEIERTARSLMSKTRLRLKSWRVGLSKTKSSARWPPRSMGCMRCTCQCSTISRLSLQTGPSLDGDRARPHSTMARPHSTRHKVISQTGPSPCCNTGTCATCCASASCGADARHLIPSEQASQKQAVKRLQNDQTIAEDSPAVRSDT